MRPHRVQIHLATLTRPAQAGVALLAGLLLCLPGCQPPPGAPVERAAPAPTMDRLVAAYSDDLASRKFQVLADFEDPIQGPLFRREPDGARDAVGISTLRAASDTGVGSLRMSLLNPSQQVVFTDAPGSEWSLYRDWAPYHLLLMSVFSPRDQGGFRFSVQSGTTSPLVYEHPRIFLKTGWNRLRIDLGEVAEHVYLGDVREMRFWCDPLDTPIELYLDDLILADNSRDLFAPPDPQPGDLYVKSQGRRLVVGAVDRFMLVFARGRIRQWFDLGSDPGRLHDLAGVGSLGPNPVRIRDGHNPTVLLDPAQWARLGMLVESYQSVLEASPLRVVVHGEWRFGTPDSPATESSPYHRWIYTIYADGRICFECSGSARTPGAEQGDVGIVFSCDGRLGFTRTVVESPASPGAATGDGVPFVLFSRPERNQADFLVVPFTNPPVQTLENPQDSRLCVLYRLPAGQEQFAFAGMMRVWPADLDATAQAAPIAAAYARPLPIAVDVGRLVRTDPGDLDHDGFSEARGYYVLQLDGRVGTIRVDGRQRLRFSPAFKIVDVAGRDVWVYVDGRQVRNVERDENDNALFEVEGVISREILIEITSGERQTGEGTISQAP